MTFFIPSQLSMNTEKTLDPEGNSFYVFLIAIRILQCSNLLIDLMQFVYLRLS